MSSNDWSNYTDWNEPFGIIDSGLVAKPSQTFYPAVPTESFSSILLTGSLVGTYGPAPALLTLSMQDTASYYGQGVYRIIPLHRLTDCDFQLALPSYGAYLSALVVTQDASQYRLQLGVAGTNAPILGQVIPTSDVLHAGLGVALGAGATSLVPPNYLWGGPVQMTVYANNASFAFTALAYSVTGAAIQIAPNVQPAANTLVTQTFYAPLGAWYIQVFNNGAAGAYDLALVAGRTGVG